MEGIEPAASPNAITWGFWAAIAGALVSAVAFPWNPVGALLSVPVFAIAAYGIRRRRAWSAFGLALLSAVSVVVALGLAIASARGSGPRAVWTTAIVLSIIWNGCIAFVLFRAGRAILAAGGARGIAWPWCALAAVVLLFFAGFRLYQMPTGSMENTLLVGDHIIARTMLVSPHRGDLIVFRYPVDHNQIFVKRIVGVGGDRIRIENKRLFVNGVPPDEPYVRHATAYTDSYRDNFPSSPAPVFPQAVKMLQQNVTDNQVVVPKDCYFVLGDNRDLSLDSRYWGFISKADVIGEPVMIYYSVGGDPKNLTPGPKSTPDLRKIRWDRVFHAVR